MPRMLAVEPELVRAGASRLRIALFHNFPFGGVKRAIYQLAQGLIAKGHTVDAFLPDTAEERYLPLHDLGMRIQRYQLASYEAPRHWRPYLVNGYADLLLRWRHLRRCASVNRDIAGAIDQARYDVAWVDKCYFASAPFVLRFLKTPTVFYCHDPWRVGYEAFDNPEWTATFRRAGALKRLYMKGCEWGQRLPQQLVRSVDRRNAVMANRILTNSYYTQAYLKRVYDTEPFVSYLGVDPAVFRPLGLPRERLVLTVGRLERRKRFELAVQAISHIPEGIRPRLVIAAPSGHDNQHRLTAMARHLRVSLEVMMGMTDEELAQWYNRASVVSYTSIREPFGLVAIEAMACGTPVVAVREGGLQESVEHGKTGWLVDAAPEAVAGAMQRVIENPALGAQMGAAGVEAVRQRWTWDHAVNRFERHLFEVAGQAMS